MTEHSTVVITEAPMALGDLIAVARGARVEIGEAARDRIRASRAVVDAALGGDQLIYGLNTGLGHMRDVRVPDELMPGYQVAIVEGHAGGLGEPLPTRVVRAAMAARLNGIARGGSGATLDSAAALAAMLNAGVHPIVPAIGSVGASDLMHMAAIAQVAIGGGRAELGGRIVDGGEALRQAGLEPLELQPKDGLALISANGVSIGNGALVVDRGLEVLEMADAAAAIDLEAIGGNASVVEPAVAAAKPVPGQRLVADRIRAMLDGSRRCRPEGVASVQDPLAFRVVPQVHGAVAELLSFARAAVELELNAADDNPLVSIAEQRLISNGNFHPMLMALAFDALRPGLAHAGLLADRRMGHLWDRMSGGPELESLEATVAAAAAGGRTLLLRYAAATRLARLRQLAAPATLDIPPLDLGVEDHATNAPETVQRTDEALDALEDLLAVGLLTARLSLSLRDGDAALGRGTSAVLRALESVLAAIPHNAQSDEIHAATREALRGPLLAAARAGPAAS